MTNPNAARTESPIPNPEHLELLATKWVHTKKLKELEVSEGLVYKKGKFSAIEEQAIKTAIEDYRVEHNLSQDQVAEVIFSKRKQQQGPFWSQITTCVPGRPIIAVYHHVHRAYHPFKLRGKWTSDEDSLLIRAVGDLGQAWRKVSEQVRRPEQDCKDRWRNYLKHRSVRRRGPWSKSEEAELTRIVQEFMTKQGNDSDTDIFWSLVSAKMGDRRSRQQCRIKWTDSLSGTVKNGGENRRWTKLDAYILVHKVASIDVRHDSEINWNILSDEDWFWSAHLLQRRWRHLRETIPGHQEMAFQEIVRILKENHAEMPKEKPPRREPKSAAVVEDDENTDSSDVGT